MSVRQRQANATAVELDPTEDLSARVLLKHIISTAPHSTPVTRSVSNEQSSSLRCITRSRTKAGRAQTPQNILRDSMKRKLRESISRRSLPPTRRTTASAMLKKANTPASSSSLLDEGDTPRHILENILQTDTVKALVVHEEASPVAPQLTSADSSLVDKHQRIEISELDLANLTFGNVASMAKGLKRKRPRRSLNVTAFEERLKQGHDDAENEEDKSAQDDLSLSLSNVTSLGIDRTEKKGLRRRVSYHQKITENEFGDAVNKMNLDHGGSGFVQGEPGPSETTHADTVTLGLSKWDEFEVTNDIIHCNTALYPQPDSAAPDLSVSAMHDKSTVMASQLQRVLEEGGQRLLDVTESQKRRTTADCEEEDSDFQIKGWNGIGRGACSPLEEEEDPATSENEEAAPPTEEGEDVKTSEEEEEDALISKEEEAATLPEEEEDALCEEEEDALISEEEEAATPPEEEEDAISEEEEDALISEKEEAEIPPEEEEDALISEEEEAATPPEEEEDAMICEEEGADSKTEDGVDSHSEEDAAAGSQSEEKDVAEDENDGRQEEGEEEEEEEEEGRNHDVEDIEQLARRSLGALVVPVPEDDATEPGGSEVENRTESASNSGFESGPDIDQDFSRPGQEEASDIGEEPDPRDLNSFHLLRVSNAEGHSDQPEEAAAAEVADPTELEEESEEDDDQDSDEIPMKTPAFVREKRKTFQVPYPISPTVFKPQANSSTEAGPPVKPKRVRKRRSGGAQTMDGGLPKNYLMSTFRHFAKAKVSADVYPVIKETIDKFLERMADDLETFAVHAGRKTIEVEDVELLLRRQGHVNDKVPVEVLIEKYLRMDQRKLLIPVATSGNVVIPKMKKR
ncbi:uncharacterized protein cenpt [Phycodurus eques]|uniref:uncharacterized protein cenpt n=1 Tax=Phycodurus eques TaxID=693459 RepID=UPI002ACE959F|nr:uncharacterized protein cenpt [Phycodurus eques]